MAERRERRRQEQDAKAEQERFMATPVEPRRAIDIAEEYQLKQGSGGYFLPGGLSARLTRRCTPVAPAEVLRLAGKVCRICQESGVIGSALHRTLAYCSCPAGEERLEQDGADWPAQESERVNGTLRTRLAAALEDLGYAHIADAVNEAEVSDQGGTLIVRPTRSCQLFFRDGAAPEQIRAALELLGEPRRQYRVEGMPAAGVAKPSSREMGISGGIKRVVGA